MSKIKKSLGTVISLWIITGVLAAWFYLVVREGGLLERVVLNYLWAVMGGLLFIDFYIIDKLRQGKRVTRSNIIMTVVDSLLGVWLVSRMKVDPTRTFFTFIADTIVLFGILYMAYNLLWYLLDRPDKR